MKKILIWYIEVVITVLIYTIPASIIIELTSKIFSISQDIPIIVGVFVGLIFYGYFKPYLSKKKIVSNFIDKIWK